MLALALLLAAADPAPVESAPAACEDKARARTQRVALRELDAIGVEPRVARIVSESLVAELRKLKGISVVSLDEVREMMAHEADKQMAGCSEASCLAEIADALGADVLVVGAITSSPTESVLSLRRITEADASATRNVVQRLTPKGGEELVAAVGPAVAELFPELALKPGAERGAAQEVALAINPPPIPAAVFWTTAAGGATLLAGAGAAGVTWLVFSQKTNDALAKSADEPIAGSSLMSDFRAANAAAITADVLLGAGVLVLGGAGVMALFTNFAGYGETDGGDAR